MLYSLRDFKSFILAALLLLGLCLFVYGNVFSNEFLMDDYLCYLGEEGLSGSSVQDLFFKGFKGIYRPVGLAYLKGQHQWFGHSPAGYHACSWILFYATCFLFFVLAYKLSGRFDLSLLASCLYAVHPINNFLLNYKTASSLTLFTIFMQLSTLFFLLFLDKKKRRWLFSSLGAFAISLFCHEISFMLPVFLFLILSYFSDRPLKKKILICSCYAVPFLIYLLLRTHAPGHIKATGVMSLDISWLSYLNTLMNLLAWYLSKLVIPVRILFTWDMRLAPHQWQVGSLCLLALLLGLLIVGFLHKQKNRILFGLVFFVVGFLPVGLASFVHTPSIGLAAIEPHWFSYSSMGFFVLAAGLLLWLKKFIPSRLGLVFILLFLTLLGYATRQGNTVWQTASGFCQYWLETNALNGSAWHCLAADYIRKEDKGPNPVRYEHCQDLALLGLGYHIKGKARLSHRYYVAALKKDQQCVLALYGVGMLYEEIESKEKSILFLKRAKSLDPGYYPAYELLKEVFLDKGRQDQYNRIKKIVAQHD